MKKKWITLIALVAVLAGGLAALLLLNPGEEAIAGDESSAEQNIYVLGGIPQPFVKEVRIRNELDTFTIVNGHQNAIQQENADGPKFSIDGIEDKYLAQSTLKSVATTAGNLPATKVVAEAGADLALYGLEKPRATVEAVYEDGSATMLVGDDTPGNEGTYVMRDGTVYLVSTAKLNNLLLSRLGFVDKKVVGGNAQSDTYEKVVLTGVNYSEPVVMEKADTTEADSMMGLSSFRIVSPIRRGVDTSRALSKLNSVIGFTADSVVAMMEEGGSLAEYGLDEPYLVTAMESEAEDIGSFELSVSAPGADGKVYLKRADRPFVYQADSSLVHWLELTLFDYMEKMIVIPYIDTVAEIEVKTSGLTRTFALSGEGDELAVTADGEPLDVKNFRQFYQTLISASYDSEIPAVGGEETEVSAEPESPAEPEASPGEEPPANEAASESSDDLVLIGGADGPTVILVEGDVILQITYRYRGGGSDTVAFYPGPPRKAIVRLNDETPYYATSLYVDRVLEDFPKVVAGEEVKSYY